MSLRRTPLPACSFCGEPRVTVEATDRPSRICATCVRLAVEIIVEHRASPSKEPMQGHGCSFCARTDAECEKLVTGPRVFICEVCVKEAGELFLHRGPR